MAIVKKFNPNHIFISKKLENKLSSIYDYPVTIVEAPTGYGKTTAVREFLKASGKPYIWFNIDSDNIERTFGDMCAKLKTINETASHKIKAAGIPFDRNSCNQIVDAVNSISYIEPTVFVVDNYHLVANKYFNELIKDLSGGVREQTRIVFITQAINSNSTFELILSKKINYFSKMDFELSKSDMIAYYKACGIKLEDEEADFLYSYTEGWISALYLQMLSYNSTNSFEITVDIENLIGKAIWNNLKRSAQDFLINISVFGSFTFRQCVYVAQDLLSEDEIEDILNNSGFIRYDAKEGKYFMHSILKYFLNAEFEKMEVVFQKKIIKSAGDWYRVNESFGEAIEFYNKIKDFEAILSMDFTAQELYEIHFTVNNKDMFLDLSSHLNIELKKKYLKNYMKFVYFLFADNEREYYKKECEIIYSIIQENYKESSDYSELLGEYYVLKAFCEFNKVERMGADLETAFSLLGKPSKLLPKKASFLFGCPSPMSLFHCKQGGIKDENDNIAHIMPIYYRITDGNSKGVEALFKAEMLLNQGEIADAGKLCEKAMYMSSTREQLDVHIAAFMCQCRISYLIGDAKKIKAISEEMKEIIEIADHEELMHMCDLCIGFIDVSVNNIEKIPAWLMDHKMIEKHTSILNLGFANVVYGRYLLLKEEYGSFLSISGEMLGIAGIYNNIIYKIYITIYIAVAKNNMGDKDRAKEILTEAIEYAKSDDIFIPFVECYSMISTLMSELSLAAKCKEFIKKTNDMAKKYAKGLQHAEKLSGEDRRFGLTKREMEVAKLAAQRLSNKEIADQLFIAESTVKSNLKVIFYKLGINSRNDLKNFI